MSFHLILRPEARTGESYQTLNVNVIDLLRTSTTLTNTIEGRKSKWKLMQCE
jgi:hypothetical protein